MSRLPRFFHPCKITGDAVVLAPSAARHAAGVLRLKSGDSLVLFDGSGTEYEAVLEEASRGSTTARIQKAFPGRPPLARDFTLYQAGIKKERWEWLVEKAAELGVFAIVPMTTKFSDFDVGKNFAKKKERWEAIAVSACEQCGRTTVPEIRPPVEFKKGVEGAPGRKIVFYEGEPTHDLREAVSSFKDCKEISIFIGPAGGFAREEIDWVKSKQLPIVSLGGMILRSETAGVAALSVLSFLLGSHPIKIL